MTPKRYHDQTPTFFHRGVSLSSRLIIYLAIGLLLMVSDTRWNTTLQLRMFIQTILQPIQWLFIQPVRMVTEFSDYTLQIQEANQQVDHLHRELQSMRQMAYDNTLLKQENQRLKGLLALEEQFDQRSTQVAYILQEYADPYTHKVVINKGSLHNIKAGSPVLDHQGVVGQVTQVFPTTSEVTLVADGKFMIPIKNLRTNTRGIAYGSPAAPIGNMELRFTLSNTDIMVGDKLVTSGIDGIYPAGLLVARVLEVQRKQNMAFSQIYLGSIGQPQKGITLLILSPE